MPAGAEARGQLTGEFQNAEDSAGDDIESVKKNSAFDERCVRKRSSTGRPMSKLKVSNGQAVGTGSKR